MQSFTDLQAWQKAMDLLEEVYKISKHFPKEELYALTSQMRRASLSIVANIAEGFSRMSSPDKAYKYTIARGECSEVHALLLASVRLGYCTEVALQDAIRLSNETGRLLSGLIEKFSENS